MIGDKYGRWNVIGDNYRLKKKTYCLCRCDCGKESNIRLDQLRRGISKSCGCLVKDRKMTIEEKKLKISKRMAVYRKTDHAKKINKERISVYRKTEKGLDVQRKCKNNYITTHPEKRKAHIATTNAISSGVLVKQPCEICGELKVQAHHDDYSKPLSVRWLCVKHHFEHHSSSKNVGVTL